MIWYDIPQNSEEWEELRRGKFTASMVSDLFMTKSTAGYKKAIRKVVYERLTGESPESFKNEYMDRGHELEPAAIEAYEMQTFNEVRPGGFFADDWYGASPDGLVDVDGQVEVKCPAYNTFIDYLLFQKLPIEYTPQVQMQLYSTGLKWCDFVAYHPKLPLVIVRVLPDPEMISQIKSNLEIAIAEVKSIIEKIQKL